MRILLTIGVIASLCACGEIPDQAPLSEETSAAQTPEETPIPVEPDSGIGDGAIPLDEAQAIANNQIPTRFQGVWDYVEGTCLPESDLRMEISADEILFYESIGKVTAATSDGDAVQLTMAMEGEGENWTEEYRLSLSDDGEFLTPQSFYEGQTSEPLMRKKCTQ